MGFVAGYIVGKMAGRGGGGGSSSTAGAVAGITAIVLMVGGIATWAIVDSQQTKSARNDLNTTIATHTDMESVNIENFNMLSEGSDYFFKFSGTASNLSGEKIDFFSAKYLVDEQQFDEVAAYMKKNKITELTTKQILKKVKGIIENAELVATTTKESVATQASMEPTTDKVILSVSKAKVEGDKVSYYVSYTEGVEMTDGEPGLLTKVSRVSYDLTDELAKDPAKVFTMGKEEAQVEVVKEGLFTIEQGSVLAIDGATTFEM